MNVIVFSKDRACQLDLLLQSMERWTPGLIPTVIHTWSTTEFREGYARLGRLLSERQFPGMTWKVQTSSLKRDVIESIDPHKPLTMFLVDDDVFFGKLPEDVHPIPGAGWSPRLGKNTTYCYMLDRRQAPPHELDFCYYFSLDGHVYRTEDILAVLKKIQFSNPNQFEQEVHDLQYFTGLFWEDQSVLVSIPHNVVNPGNSNRNMGGSAEKLNKLFLDGWRIDYRALLEDVRRIGVKSPHQEFEYPLVGKTPKSHPPAPASARVQALRVENEAALQPAPQAHKMNRNPLISVVHATARMPDGWRAAYEHTIKAARHPEQIEYILGVDAKDWPALQETFHEGILVAVNYGPCQSTAAYNVAAKLARAPVLYIGADDQFPPEGWDDEIAKRVFEALGDKPAHSFEWVMHVSSGSPSDDHLMAPQILSRARYNKLGYVFHPAYWSMYADNEFTEHAYLDKCVIQARDLVWDHRHPALNRGSMDKVYEHENDPESYQIGAWILAERRRLGFPKDWKLEAVAPNGNPQARPKIIDLCAPGEHFSSAWVAHWTVLLLELSQRCVVNTHFAFSSNVYTTRSVIAENLLLTKPRPDYLLWIDDDNLVTFEQLTMLMEDLETYPDIDMVSGWCYVQPEFEHQYATTSCGKFSEDGFIAPIDPVDMRAAQSKGLIDINYTGFPVVLMRFETLKRVGPHPFAPMLDNSRFGFKGEDVAFSWRAREKGIKMVCDPRVRVPHLKMRDVPGEPTAPPPEKVERPAAVVDASEDSAEEDRKLSNRGMEDYAAGLGEEDRAPTQVLACGPNEGEHKR